MNEDQFNMSLRKFLKQVGVTSQREIERLVREKGLSKGKLKVKVVLTAPGTSLNHVVEDELDLGGARRALLQPTRSAALDAKGRPLGRPSDSLRSRLQP